MAFIASSGLKGFEIVINSMLSNERNILLVMLQDLISDLDIEGGGGSTESSEIWRERYASGFVLLMILIVASV